MVIFMEYNSKLTGNRIRKRRKQLKMKQCDLAEAVSTSNNHMSGIERGLEKPSVDLLLKICDVLNTTPDYLLIGVLRVDNSPENMSTLLKLCTNEEIDSIYNMIEAFVKYRK